MNYLGDYLGQLLAEISMARMQADLETIRLAELYASNPLLRTMPVPHMRLPEVELDIPILVQSSDGAREGESVRGGARIGDMRLKFDEQLVIFLSKARVKLSATENTTLRAALEERWEMTRAPMEISIDVQSVADDLCATTVKVIKRLKCFGSGKAEALISPSLENEFRDRVRMDFLKLRTSPPRLTVMMTCSDLHAAGASECLARLRLKVAEQGMEWARIESDDGESFTLVPE
jgi:hypothetical protein